MVHIYRMFIDFDEYYPQRKRQTGRTAVIGKLRTFVKCESGATAIEYGLIAAGISVAIITVVNGLGTQLSATFTKIKTSLAAQ